MRPLRWCAAGALLATAHTALNAMLLRRPPEDPSPTGLRVSVLLPVRNEAARLTACLRALQAQQGVDRLQILVLDDGSSDGSADIARRIAADDERVEVRTGAPLPPGWLGKPFACQQLADAVRPETDLLVFVDADVVLAAHAIASAADCLLRTGLDLVCPYPRQVATGAAARLVQPLLQWSWLTFLPLRLAERSPRPALSAANGQFLVVDRSAYLRAGGHATVRAEVVEDIALLRAVKRTGGLGGVVDGTALATCTMYDGWEALSAGYQKSLWTAFGSPAGACAAVAMLAALYVVPPLAALRGSRAGLVGYLAGVAGRAIAANRTGGRVWPDSAAQPASVLLVGWLTARSISGHRRGTLGWKGRSLP
ncbi:MAG: glycosyltransferase family 2 protein [Mycobacteriales bacterium]